MMFESHTGESPRLLRVLFVGLSSPPEEFIHRKLDGLSERRMVAIRAGHPIRSLPCPKPDVVHFEWISAAIGALPFHRLWDVPVVVSCRGTQLRVRPHVTPGYSAQLRETFERATAVHCVCDAIRDEAVALGLDPLKAHVIYPAVDTGEFAPSARDRQEGPLRLLSVGALIWTKGYEYALLTLRSLLNSGVQAHLEIIGTGDERQRVVFTTRELDLDEHVTLRGRVPAIDVRAALQRTDVFLHSSLSEGISNAVLEAMACGVPVVTTDCGGMREAVTNGHDGFVVPVRDPKAAATAVATLARDAGLRERMGRSARATVESRFRLQDQISRWVTLYRRLAAVTAP